MAVKGINLIAKCWKCCGILRPETFVQNYSSIVISLWISVSWVPFIWIISHTWWTCKLMTSFKFFFNIIFFFDFPVFWFLQWWFSYWDFHMYVQYILCMGSIIPISLTLPPPQQFFCSSQLVPLPISFTYYLFIHLFYNHLVLSIQISY